MKLGYGVAWILHHGFNVSQESQHPVCHLISLQTGIREFVVFGFFGNKQQDGGSTEFPGFLHAVNIFQRSEEHTSELQSLMRSSYAVFCLKKKKNNNHKCHHSHHAARCNNNAATSAQTS